MLIIFDFDGVLRNTSWQGAMKAYEAIIKSRGRDPKDFFTNLYEFKLWFDNDWRKNLDKIGTSLIPQNITEAELFHSVHDPYVTLFPWTEKILFSLRKRHSLAILSSSDSSSIKKSLGNLHSYFKVIIGSDQIKAIKPDPDGINTIIALLGKPKKKTLMIGDTEVDILAGKSAGVKTGAVSWGGMANWPNLIKLKPNYKFTRPEQLCCF